MKQMRMILSVLLICLSGFSVSCSPASPPLQSSVIVQSIALPTESDMQEPSSNIMPEKSKKPKEQTSEAVVASGDFIAPALACSPTESTVVINVVPAVDMKLYIEYGSQSGNYNVQTEQIQAAGGLPKEISISGLSPDSRYYYRVRYSSGSDAFSGTDEEMFVTQRTAGNAFTFCMQGDSHPERLKKQFDPDLYLLAMDNIRVENPDFYITMGDDFSVDSMKTISQEAVERLYINQREYLGLVNAPVFLVNGNHEQEAAYVLDGTPDNAAVWGCEARNAYFSQPLPDGFYTGDTEQVDHIGLLRDYYAYTWGDALFVVIDPYWHSSVPVDNVLGGGKKRSNLWDITLGDEQYQWLKTTLENSNAKYKFVFAHHVLGTGRGGTDIADQAEWGGYNKKGVWEFDKMRPGWELPIQQLMARTGVTIFFQGHDHVFVKQELDGVVYQSLPSPADPNYALNNADAYKSDAIFPSSGYVRVSVSPESVTVDYIASVLPEDETENHYNGQKVYSYTITDDK